jgi:predicted dehydrogenase
MSRLRVAIMGCADFAWRAMAPAIAESPDMTLVAVASRSREKAERFAAQFNCDAVTGYAPLLERDDVDAVYVPLPTGLHAEWVSRALTSGKHVLVEKTCAMTLSEARELVATARANERLLVENILFPHHSQFRWMQNFIAGGDLGEVHLVRGTFGFPPLTRDNFRYNMAVGGGALFDVGCYLLKLSRLLLGESVSLMAAQTVLDVAGDVDIYGDAMLKNAAGQVSQVSYGFNYFYQCHCEVLGTQGKLVVERMFTPPPGFSPTVRIEKQDGCETLTLDADNHFANMCSYFAACVSSGENAEEEYNAILQQADLLAQVREASQS